jgi:hypothetical protein
LALHCTAVVHLAHALDTQMGAVDDGHSVALVAVQSTHLPAVSSHVPVGSMQRLLLRPLHWSHLPSLWHAGVVALRAAQAVSPPALSVQVWHWCVLVLQMGLSAPQSLLAMHCTQVLFAVLQTLFVVSSVQSVLSSHSTHAPLLSLHVVSV